MALRVSAAMVLCLLFSLMAFAHCVPLEEAVTAVPDGEGPLRLPSRDGTIVSDEVVLDGEVPMEEEKEEVVNPVAEPDPDRLHPDADSYGEEELTALKPSAEGEQGDEKTKEQIDDDEDEEEEEKKKTKKSHEGGDKDEKKEKTKNKRKKHDCKEKKEKKTKKHHQSNDEEEEEEKMKKQIHHHHHVEKEKTKNRPHHNSGNDSDNEDEQEKKSRRWRKAISRRSRFGHGRRSQREEAQNEEVKN